MLKSLNLYYQILYNGRIILSIFHFSIFQYFRYPKYDLPQVFLCRGNVACENAEADLIAPIADISSTILGH